MFDRLWDDAYLKMTEIQRWFEEDVLPFLIQDERLFADGQFIEGIDHWEMNERLMVDCNILKENGKLFVNVFTMYRDLQGNLNTRWDDILMEIDCKYT